MTHRIFKGEEAKVTREKNASEEKARQDLREARQSAMDRERQLQNQMEEKERHMQQLLHDANDALRREMATQRVAAPARGSGGAEHVPMQKFNLALVDTSEMKIKGESIKYKPEHPMWPVWKANARRMVRQLADSGTTSMGYHINADDLSKIDDAFAAVARLMADTDVAAG